ncbi:MAG: antibiotic biosynthesis monooxygenase family protein [Cyclobacteriaceae bacterium]
MLKRIVRMEFDAEKAENFLALFEGVKEKIAAREGCTHLELCRDATQDNVYYTLSHWEREEDLESYRNSILFKETWARTKVLFGGKPQAFSLMN